MALKKLKGSTSGQLGTIVDYSQLTKKAPEKSLVKTRKQKSGRNAHGHITVRHRGGGAKRKIRTIDNRRCDKLDIPAKVQAREYDPGRSAFILLLAYVDGEKRYVIAPEGVEVGATIICSDKAKPTPGNRLLVGNIPVGYPIHDVELTPGAGGSVIKSAGASGKIISQDGERAQLQLPSGEVRYIHKGCYATIGVVSNSEHGNVRIGKAGRMRRMGRRPQVLGKSMNPVDHPHGGGEGHSPIGLTHPKTPWGAPALGKKTRNKRKPSSRMIIRRRKK